MCGMVNKVILSVLLYVCVCKVDTQQLGQLNFDCEAGWHGHNGNCYLEVTVPMTWNAATETCSRQGGHLLWVDNEIEYDYISSNATVNTFWVGLKYTNDGSNTDNALWPTQHDQERTVNMATDIAFWGINEPTQGNSNGYTACGLGRRNQGLSDTGLALKSCDLKRPFYCKYEACLQGQTPCATGGECYLATDKCDGRNDCEDQSDERDCRTADQCNYYYQLTQMSGNFVTARIQDGTRCLYVLEAPIGKKIRISVPTLSLEKDIALLEIWTGSPDLTKASRLATLTGVTQQQSYISMNNFMTVLLMVGDVVSSRTGITITWTTDIPEISDTVIETTIDSTWRCIEPPFTKETTPMYLEQSWRMTATEGEIIMYYMQSYEQSEGASLTIQEGGLETSPSRTMDPLSVNREFFASAASTLQVHWNSGSGMSSFRFCVKTGCDIVIDEAVGSFQVPNYWVPDDSYPNELTCTWTLTGGQTRNRGLALNFLYIGLGGDPRLDPESQDIVTIWKDSATDGMDITTSGVQHAPGGHIKVEFKSDLIINEGAGFTAEFSIDCPALDVSDETLITPDDTLTYDTRVTITCALGYKFDAEEYHSMSSVELICKEGGTWTYSDRTDIRIPNCEVVQCGVPTEIQNGYIFNVTGTSYGGTAWYECNEGFSKSHSNPAQCDTDGTWQNVPTCTSATCTASDIQGIVNGNYEVEAGNNITSASVDSNTIVKFSCDPGYELIGSLRSHCRAGGWSDPRPECHRIYCPFPIAMNAQNSNTQLQFEATARVTCAAGYGINGSVLDYIDVTCNSDRTLTPTYACSDIDECLNNPCDATTTRCENNQGSYSCVCLDGYQSTSQYFCQDIAQCSDNNGGCSSGCVEETGGLPGYHCTCQQGWTLFTENGIHGHSIPAGETGHQPGDVYYYNHTCVRVSCERPTDTSHATLLSTESRFYYEDTVDLVCNDGYHITGAAETVTRQTRTCGFSGWDNGDFTCSARTCSTGMNPLRGTYDQTTVNFGEMVVLTCEWTASTTDTRSARCMYKGGVTKFVGDDITTCPQIDCGPPADSMPTGGLILGNIPSTVHLDNDTFLFSCQSGYQLEGTSEITEDHYVQCKENGRWSFGTLRCSGQKCSDPGTPAEAVQVVTNYEAGQNLTFTCNRDGYQPVPAGEYICTPDAGGSGIADWVPSLFTLPVCKDVISPQIHNLPNGTVYRDMMDMASFIAPAFMDNFGVKQTSASDSFMSSDIVTGDITITYTAEDYDGNTATASVVIEVIDRNNNPSLDCPDYQELEVDSETSMPSDIRQHVSSNGTLQFSQEYVILSIDNIGTYVRIDVIASNDFDTKSYCSFLVTFKANRCFRQTLYPDSYATRSCSDLQGDGTMSCYSTCISGYMYGDGETMKTFTCTGANNWGMNYPHVFCLPTAPPAYQFTASVLHGFDYLSGQCESAYQTEIANNLDYFESRMSAQAGCSGIQWDITHHTASRGSGSQQFVSTFTVELKTTAISDAERYQCISAIRDTASVFDFPNDRLASCASANAIPLNGIRTANLTTTEGEFACVSPSYILIESSQLGTKCIPCGPGQFHDGTTCTSCPQGQYQDDVDGTCQVCNTGETPNTQLTDCIITCPAGFRSNDGLFPCSPCLPNNYWMDTQTCEPCGSVTSTSGREGVTDASGCYDPCPIGTYSLTGYQDMQCKPCPQNFYQPNVGRTTCIACASDQMTENTGQSDVGSCIAYTFQSGESCNRTFCSDHGNCAFVYHRPVCSCDDGYKGDRCDESFHICDGQGSPCMNQAQCIPTPGGTFTDYTCECRVEENIDLCFNTQFPGQEGGDGYFQPFNFLTLAQCQTQCLYNNNCKSVTYIYTSTVPLCLLYSTVIAEDDLQAGSGRTHYTKDCPPVFGGARCEEDLINGCNGSQCSSESMCKDTAEVVDGYECLCPSVGGYQGTYCHQTATPCSAVNCANGGTCNDLGSVAYECSCRAGFTGRHCDKDIDDCHLHDNACLFGTCNDDVNEYSCSCENGFGGDWCQVTPNFCSSTNCLGNNICYNSIDDLSGRCHCMGPYYMAADAFACNATGYNPCDAVTCFNGTCSQGICLCDNGYTGSQCQHSIDDCIESSCVHGQCVDEHQGYRCECDTGYDGTLCDNNINDCPGHCGDHGTCKDLVGGYICHCQPGYTGSECETDIDECLSAPCYNGGTCTQQVNGFTCQCVVGWEGTQCQNWNMPCTPGLCQNNGQCFNLKEIPVCRCGGGTQGEYCDGLRSVCETISNAAVCLNSGSCQDEGGSAVCKCPGEENIELCFNTQFPGQEGGDGYFQPFNFLTLAQCQTQCLNNNNCKSVTYIYKSTVPLCLLYSTVKAEGDLQPNAGSTHYTKDCPPDYAGVACEQVRDWCSPNPCENNGQCITNAGIGFQCQCEDGYSGRTCEIAADPCSSSPCPTGATCQSDVTQYYCQCPEGRDISSGSCRAGVYGTDLILLLADAVGEATTVRRRRQASFYGVPGDLPTLKTAFRMTGSTLSVQLWVRIHRAKDPFNVLRLVGSDSLFPLEDTSPKLVLLITNSQVQLSYETETISLDFTPLELAEWYHIGVSLSANKMLSYTINAVEVPDPVGPLDGSVSFTDFNAQLVFGDTDVVMEYNRVSAWETALTNSDFANALENKDYIASGAIKTQGWYNVKLTKASKILTTELSPDFYSSNKTMPTIMCDRTTAYAKVSTERVVRRSELSHLMTRINGVRVNQGSIKYSIPEELTWGYYPGIVSVEANGRQSVCRFPVYIKYYDTCPAPVNDGDVSTTPCPNSDGVCDRQCISGNAQISAPTPRYRPCGALGVYDWNMPHKKLVLPTCAAGVDQKYVVMVTMQYQFSISCSNVPDIETQLPDAIREIFNELNTEWTEICVGTDCTNLNFHKVECVTTTGLEKRIDLQFSLSFNSETLTALRDSGIPDGRLKLDDALKSIIVLENKIDLSRFASAAPVFSSVVVTMRSDCTTQGYSLIDGICVPCGKGMVYSEEMGQCEFCPVGTYKGDTDLECMPCGTGMTTVNVGTTSQTRCIDECAIGRYYDEDGGVCKSCPRHYYQDEVGQTYCKPCKIGFKTLGEGSDKLEDCKEDCEAGYARNTTGYCVICARGYWRDLLEDDCQPCDAGNTTIPGEIAISMEKCSMETCPIGTYWNVTEQTCKECDHGQYQDEMAMLSCKLCAGNRTTNNTGESDPANCLFYCAVGYEVNPVVDEACLPCQRGFYKDNMGNTKFETCQQCVVGMTTDDIAANSADLCEYEICGRGQYLENRVCQACDIDYYQSIIMPDSSVQCVRCPAIGQIQQGTESSNTESVTDCKPICGGGQYFDATGVQCVDCSQGYYKPATDRFGNCIQCPENFTTDMTNSAMKTSIEDCNIPLCGTGTYVEEVSTGVYECTPCDLDKYQPDMYPTVQVMCMDCSPTEGGVNTGTRTKGASSADLCEPVCPGGQEYQEDTDECAPCPVGKYKPDTPADRFEMCSNCPTGFTTDGTGKMSDGDCNIRDCDPGSMDNGTDCIPCPYGFYQELRTQTNCTACGTNLNTSREGATSHMECQAFCGAGQQVTNDPNNCELCPESYYKPSPSYDPCEICPIDYTSNEARTACNILHCSAGKEHVERSTGAEECVNCSVGSYKDSPGNAACSPCPANWTNDAAGQTACEILHCEPGKYEKNGICVPCEVGYYKTLEGNRNCTVCPYRKTTAGSGTVYETECNIVVCEMGQYREGEDVCKNCSMNQYQNMTGQTSCFSCSSGKVTMQEASTSINDCVPECGKGQQYNTGTRVCDACPQRYYKDTVGNFQTCTECPLGKTTVGVGSDKVADCSQADCNPGTYVYSTGTTVICQECPKNTYQPMRSQDRCLNCSEGKITEETGSIRETQCVVRCPAGYELIYNSTQTCRKCAQGFYNDGQGANPNTCKRCPTGYTTSTTGKSECTLPDPLPRPPQFAVSLVFIFIYRVEVQDCSITSLTVVQAVIQNKIRTGMNNRRQRYRGLCGLNKLNCDTITVSLKGCTAVRRRKREITHNLEVEVTMPDSVNLVNDTNGDMIETSNLVVRLFESSPEDFSPQAGTIEYGQLASDPTVIPVCEPGYEVSGTTCSACSAGKYWHSTTETCEVCPVNQYQNMAAQTTCIMCPDLTYNDNTGATAVTDCKSYCAENPNYCNSQGTCSETGRKTAQCDCDADYVGERCDNMRYCLANPDYCSGHGTCTETGLNSAECTCVTGYFGNQCQNLPYCTEHSGYCNGRGECTQDSNNNPSCSCNAGFYGDRCESKTTPDSDQNALIGGLVGGIGGLLVVILIVVGVVMCLKQRGKIEKKRRHLHQPQLAEEPEYFRNPIYDNRSSVGSMPAVFTNIPAAEYYPDPYSHHSYPNKRFKNHDQNETHDEADFIWQA